MENINANSMEQWCNEFAMSLLMPASIVRTMWAQGIEPKTMAQRFGVSLDMLAHRLNSLGLLSI